MKRLRTLNLFLLISLVTPSVSVYAESGVQSASSAQESQPDPGVSQQQYNYAEIEAARVEFARSVLGTQRPSGSLFSSSGNEAEELEVDRVVRKISQFTSTLSGKWALYQMMTPIADSQTVLERQKMIRTLAEDQEAFGRVGRTLQLVKQAERSLLRYWDPQEASNSGRLFNKAHNLYYRSVPSLAWLDDDLPDSNTWLNDRRWALEAVALFDIGDAAKRALFAIGMDHFTSRFTQWMQGKLKDVNGNRQKFNPLVETVDALYSPMRRHDPRTLLFKNNYDATWDSYMRGMFEGSLGDRMKAAWDGYETDPEDAFELGPIKYHMKKTSDLPWYSKWFWRTTGMAGAVGGTIAMDFFLAKTIKGIYDHSKMILVTMKALRVHMCDLAKGIRQLKRIKNQLVQDPLLKDHRITKQLQAVFASKHEGLQELLTLLESDTFKSAEGMIFARGKVLYTHRLLQKHCKQFTPVLRAIGELDAYYTLAAMTKVFATEPNGPQLSFVQFIESETPVLEIKNGWSLLINGAPVCNSVSLGGNQPANIVITGPNGGGKSGMLKMIGNVAVLAQSCGLAPAEQVAMSWLDGICTSFNPRENMEHDISTFMAQQKSMEEVRQRLSIRANKKMLTLIDEPFNGTVDAERAVRTYKFGEFLAGKQSVISCMATHVEKPIELATKHPRSFANYYLEILEPQAGSFQRTYRFVPGVASWWFNDADRRSRYVDWLLYEQGATLAPAFDL